jgi:hypothetical protein
MSQWLTSIGRQGIDLSYLNRDLIYRIYRSGKVIISQANYYLFFGDLHGNIKASIVLAIRLQTLFKVSLRAVFQVGDFGFWPTGMTAKNEDPHYKKEDCFDFFEMKQSTETQSFLSLGKADFDILTAPFYFIRGNHEDFNHLNSISKDTPAEVLTGIYFIPDYFNGVIENLHVMALGGILTDLERGKGQRAKIELKKSQQKLKTDQRRSNASLLVQLNSVGVDLLLTHSGLASREDHDGSKQLEAYLSHSDIRLHFYGHHHRFSLGDVGKNTLSIGLRNLDTDTRGMLRTGSFALVAWNDRNNFEIYSDASVSD